MRVMQYRIWNADRLLQLLWFRVNCFGWWGLLIHRWRGLNGFLELHQDHGHVVASLTTSCWWCQTPIKYSLTNHRKLVFLHDLQYSASNRLKYYNCKAYIVPLDQLAKYILYSLISCWVTFYSGTTWIAGQYLKFLP